jgi:putative hydroxymethylpyrimidine transport system substrate-binding protein
MSISRRSLLATALAAGSTPLLTRPTSAQTSEAISIALDWFPNANHAGLFLAEATGQFANAEPDISLVTPADPTTVLQTVAAGRDTFGISYQPDVLLARAADVPVVAIAALVPRPLLGVMSLKEAGIARPADLAGRKVGYTGIPSQEAFLRTMLEADGVSMDDIELINVEFNLLPALISKQAEATMGAFWTHETIVAEREGYPVDLMRVEDWGVPIYNELVIVTSEQTMRDRGEVVELVLGIVRDGYLAAAADQETALNALVTAYPEADIEVERKGLALLAELWAQPSPGFGILVREQWTEFAAWMLANGLLSQEVDASQAIAGSFISESVATPAA